MESRRLIRGLSVAAALLACLAQGCTTAPAGSTAAVPLADAEPVLEKDIVYSTRGETKLLLDVARPAKQDRATPAVIFVHGWAPDFDKMQHRPEIIAAARRGYVGVAISVRLPSMGGGVPGAVYPEPIHDVKAAIRWVRANAARYGVNPDRVGLVGFSFGGYLALMAAFTGAKDGLEGDTGSPGYSTALQAVVAAAPVVTFDLEFSRPEAPQMAPVMANLSTFYGGTPDQVPDRYKAANPVTYMDAADTPTLALFGSSDTAVAHVQAGYLAGKIMASHLPVALQIVPKATHNFAEVTAGGADHPMWAFLDQHLKAR